MFAKGLHPNDNATIRQVVGDAAAAGAKLYLVGGYLRDVLSGKATQTNVPKDIDFAVEGTSAVQLAKQLADKLAGHFVLLDETLDTARVVFDNGIVIDFAGVVGGSIKTDILRRDFTINALAWDPNEPDKIIDLVNGESHLKNKIVQAISEENLLDDPLRLLRAFRFQATTSCKIDGQTFDLIKKNSKYLAEPAAERINYELFKILETEDATSILQLMGEADILEVIFPELTATRQVTTNAYHHLGLWDHSLEVVRQSELWTKKVPAWVMASAAQDITAGISRLAATKLACLLHDIGKPATWVINDDGRHTFYGHDKVGADLCQDIAKRLKWSTALSKFIVKLVAWHLRPGHLFHQGPPTEKAVNRFYRNCGVDVPELMLLAFGDLGATCGPGLEVAQKDALEKSLIELLIGFPVYISKQESTPCLLDGKRVMRLLDIGPGPVVGEILEALYEAQCVNEVVGREAAERFVHDYYRRQRKT